MADLKSIKGFHVQNIDGDPDNPIVGDLYYNTSAGAFKAVGAGGAPIGTWASAPSLNNARSLLAAAGASNSAAMAFGGDNSGVKNLTETFNGSSWTEVSELNNARSYLVGIGTSTAGLAVGGQPPATAGYTESWNGASWTTKSVLSRGSASPQASSYAMGGGTNSSAVFFGGDEGAPAVQDLCESWNGSAWSETGDLNTARSYAAGCGSSNTSALCISGFKWTPGLANAPEVESFNGTSWTEEAEVNTARGQLVCANTGTTTDALKYTGRNAPDAASSATCEHYNGTAWTEVADLGGAQKAGSGAGTSSSALSMGGANPSVSAVVESWTADAYQIKTVPTS